MTLKDLTLEILKLYEVHEWKHASAVLERDFPSDKKPGRTQVNLLRTRKREHSRKPDELYPIIEACSPGPYLELFARHKRKGWEQWGNGIAEDPLNLFDSDHSE